MRNRNLSLPARLLGPTDPGGNGTPPNPEIDPGVPPVPPNNPSPNTNTDPGLQQQIDDLKQQLQDSRSQQSTTQAREEVFSAIKARFVESGLSEEDAEVYAIATLTTKPKQDQPPARPTGNSGGDLGDDGPSQSQLEIQQLKAELMELRRAVGRGETRSLEGQFRNEIQAALDSTPELATIMERAGADNASEIRKILMEDLDRTTKDLLRTRKEATRSWDNKWIGEEAKKAAALLHKRYRTVIGDPGRLGPSETVAEADRLLATKPVAAPEYKPGMSIGDAQAASRSYAADQIARAMAEATKASGTIA